MARTNLDAWIPEEDGSAVIQKVRQTSAVERLARRIPMSTAVRNEPRSGGVGVETIAKGGVYGEDSGTDDTVTLTVRKFGRAIRIAEEDLNDTLANVIATKQSDWSTSYAKALDNASLATTGAENGTTVPFTSVYAQLATAGSRIVQTGTGGAGAFDPPTYDEYSEVLGIVEAGDYFEDGSLVTIAHPLFRSYLRGVKDTNGNPIFVKGLAGTPDTIFGHEVYWSNGARTNATASPAPTGNPLLIHGNRDLLMLGVRSGPESIFIDGRSGLSALTDEAILKMRARRAFNIGHVEGFAALEVRKTA